MHKSLPLVDDLLPNRLSHPRHPHSRWPQFYSLKDHSALKLGKNSATTNLRVEKFHQISISLVSKRTIHSIPEIMIPVMKKFQEMKIWPLRHLYD